MRVVDLYGKDVTNPDINYGYLIDSKALRKDVEPIDDIVKFHYYDDDFELVKLYIKYKPGEKEDKAKSDEFNKKYAGGIVTVYEIQAETDIALCNLYEELVSTQATNDIAVCELYELIIGGGQA